MKVLKRQVAMVVLCMLCVAAFVLAVVFTLPARPVNAEEGVADEVVYTTVAVSSEKALKDAVKNAKTTPTKIILENNIEMNAISSGEEGTNLYELVVERGQTIQIDLAGFELSVPAQQNSEGCVIVNRGTLSIVDTPDYKGAVVSNGYLTDAGSWMPATGVIHNYGALTVNANVRMHCSMQSGYFQTFNVGAYLIRSQIDPTPYGEEQTIIPATLTIDGGNFDADYTYSGAQVYYPMNHFFLLKSSDLTVNGGIFRNTYSYNPPYFGGFLAELVSLEQQEPNVEAKIKEYRHVDVKIINGDFGDKKLLNRYEDENSLLYMDTTGNWIPGNKYDANIEGEGFSIEISGGVFPYDVSAYVDGEHTAQQGDDGFYHIKDVDKSKAVVILKSEDGTPLGYYEEFANGWLAAQSRALAERKVVIEFQKNISSGSLVLQTTSGDASIIFDLNGYEFTVTQDSTSSRHIQFANAYAIFSRTLVVRDTSEEQSGKLNLVYLENATNGGISVGKTSDKVLNFVLESGTITRTGGGFYEAPPEGFGSTSEKNKSIFYLSSLDSCSGAVTIKGGNVLSQLDGDDQGYLITDDNAQSDQPEDFELNRYRECISVDVAKYLSEREGQVCRFSWNVEPILGENVTGAVAEDGSYVVKYTKDNENYMVGTTRYQNLSDAFTAAQSAGNHTVVLLRDITEEGDVEIPENVTLDLNRYVNYTFAATTLILNDGSAVANGTVQANVVVKGNAQLSVHTLAGDVSVEAGGKILLKDGIYEGNLFAQGDGTIRITGGQYKTDVEQYIQGGFGAEKSGEYTKVKATIVSKQALAWFNSKGVTSGIQTTADGDTYYVNNEDEFLYLSSIVNSGTHTFQNDKIILNNNLDFSEYVFLPVGTYQKPFMGAFDGQNKEISGIVAQEKFVGLFGHTQISTHISNVTLRNSTFFVGNGYLDELNSGTGNLGGGAIIGDAYNGSVQTNIVLENVNVKCNIENYSVFSGALVGHTWGSVTVDKLKMTKSSVLGGWKAGGVVGYYESGTFTIKNSEISDIKVDSFVNPGAVVGHVNGQSATFENCKVETPDLTLVGQAYEGGASANIKITGAETDIHVESFGVIQETAKIEIELSTEGENSSQVQFSAGADGKLPSNLTITDSNGGKIVENGETVGDSDFKVDPENGSLIFEADPLAIDLYTGSTAESSHTGSYSTLAEALEAAQDGDRIYLTNDVTAKGNVTINSGKNVTINLGGKTLTGNITVEGKLILEHGTVKGSIKVSGGTLTLVWAGTAGEDNADLTIGVEGSEQAAIDGKYTVQGSACARKKAENGVVTQIQLFETHSYERTAEGNVITVTCTHCDLSGSITITADDFTCDGNEHEATVTGVPEWLVSKDITIKYEYSKNGTDYKALDAGKLPTERGYYKASIEIDGLTASVEFSIRSEVVVCDIVVEEVTYGDNTVTATSFKLKDAFGNDVDFTGEDLTLTVTLKKSNYNVGTNVALIVGLSLDGDAMADYTLALAGQQAFVEVEVTPARLVVRAVGNGTVEYEGFVNGEDESVLTGELVLERKGNVITPSGLESANYDIVFESVTVPGDLTALWVGLAIAGMSAILAAGLYIGYRRKRQ